MWFHFGHFLYLAATHFRETQNSWSKDRSWHRGTVLYIGMHVKPHAERFLEDEAQSLEYRYRPGVATNNPASNLSEDNEIVQRIADRMLKFRALEHDAAPSREEQERELSPEIVQEREVQRPTRLKPARHEIHHDLLAFVVDGMPRSGSDAFKPAFETLRRTSAASHFDVSQFPRDILTTSDFASTVQVSGQSSLLDAYQRSVQWILTSVGNGCDNLVKYLAITSPFEAQMLQTDVRNSKKV